MAVMPLPICSGFLTVVLFCGGREAHAESPEACVWRGTHFSSLDPWLCPTPALTQPKSKCLQGASCPPLPTPAARRPQRKKHKKRETPPFLETTSPPAHSHSFLKKMKVKKKKKPANLENFLEKIYLKLSDPDQHPPDPHPVILCLECVRVFTPVLLLAASCAGGAPALPSAEMGSKGCSRQLPMSLRAPPSGPGPGSINPDVAP